jgi:hypothetical protein
MGNLGGLSSFAHGLELSLMIETNILQRWNFCFFASQGEIHRAGLSVEAPTMPKVTKECPEDELPAPGPPI